MKNKLLKGAHLSERKVREIVKLFCDDLTATQIAGVTGISRITINAYLKMLRCQIAEYSLSNNPLRHINGYFHNTLNAGNGESRNLNVTTPFKDYYGIFKHDKFIYTHLIANNYTNHVQQLIQGKLNIDSHLDETLKYLQVYQGIADFNVVRLIRIYNTGLFYAKRTNNIDEVDLFWSSLKSRMVKFRGLNAGTLHLHVKETEFRYNNRETDLNEIVMRLLHSRPLHLIRSIE